MARNDLSRMTKAHAQNLPQRIFNSAADRLCQWAPTVDIFSRTHVFLFSRHVGN
jgi:urease accessory protein UreF